MRETTRLAQKGLTEEELRQVRPFALRVEEHLSGRVFEKMARAFPDADLETMAQNAARIAFLSGVKPVMFDCCEDSCCCYTGAWAEKDACPYCQKPRRDLSGKPRKQFLYIPLIPRLVALFENRTLCEKLQYRHNFKPSTTNVSDIFDGRYYQSLRKKFVRLAGGLAPHQFFDGKNDLALGFSTDGFCPFKRRKMSTWPLLIFNYNLPPEERFHFENILCLGTIPGPHSPKDMDSFLHPFVEEALELAAGVRAFDAIDERYFALRAYLLVVFGDIPAVTKVLRMVGTNGIFPCRICNIRGAQGTQNNVYYVPHNRDHPSYGPDRTSYDPLHLPRRSHNEMLEQARAVDSAETEAEARRLATNCGIRGETILSSIPSIDLACCFPYGFMHLVWENVVQTLFQLWTEDYKDFPPDGLPYRLPVAVVQEIGRASAAANDTIPSQFGARIPNYATNKHEFKADTWSVFSQYLAPVLLRGRFGQGSTKYYDHFVRFIGLVKLCMQFEISHAEIDQIRQGFAQWVIDYEKLYYRHDPRFVSACTINIHALLHIADTIELLGPVWAYWEFPMERYCGRLLPAIKSRRHPFITVAKHCVDLARLSQIKIVYNAQEALSLGRPRKADLKRGEYASEAYPYCILFAPRPDNPPPPVLNKIVAALATRFEVTATIIRRYVLPSQIRQFGKVRRVDGGDVMHAHELVPIGPFSNSTRDASFVRYELLVDRHERRRNRTPEYEPKTYYGRLERIFVLRIPQVHNEYISIEEPQDIILAAVSPCKIIEHDKRIDTSFYSQLAPMEVVDIAAIQAVVGRVPDGQKWAIVDRSGPLARAEFVDDGVD